jgi:hypothetical protein
VDADRILGDLNEAGGDNPWVIRRHAY